MDQLQPALLTALVSVVRETFLGVFIALLVVGSITGRVWWFTAVEALKKAYDERVADLIKQREAWQDIARTQTDTNVRLTATVEQIERALDREPTRRR